MDLRQWVDRGLLWVTTPAKWESNTAVSGVRRDSRARIIGSLRDSSTRAATCAIHQVLNRLFLNLLRKGHVCDKPYHEILFRVFPRRLGAPGSSGLSG